jgi:hypothetical protein
MVDDGDVDAVACDACIREHGIVVERGVDWREDIPKLNPVCGHCFRSANDSRTS